MERPDRVSPHLQAWAALQAENAERFAADSVERLSHSEAVALFTSAVRVDLASRQVLSHGDLPVQNVYFIETGIVSVMAKAGMNRWVEAWMVGPGGFVGLPEVLTGGRSAYRRIVTIGGAALCVSGAGFRRRLQSSRRLRTLALQRLAFQLLQASQFGACNAQHTAMERVARWLLLASDEIRESRVAVSHETLARVLGVRRATISECSKQLEARRAIRASRRMIEIADRNALLASSCDCYRIVSKERRRYANAESFL